jgi:hypothetical protein
MTTVLKQIPKILSSAEIIWIKPASEKWELTRAARYGSIPFEKAECVYCKMVPTHVIKYRAKDESIHADPFYVGNHATVLFTIDHILPHSLGGMLVPANLRSMCAKCNYERRTQMSPSEIDYINDNFMELCMSERKFTQSTHPQKALIKAVFGSINACS